MRNLIYILIFSLSLISCKTQEARKPVTVKTGSFIDASVERNKQLNEKERTEILEFIASQPNKTFIASENGFWYHYNIKIDNDTLITPSFGDIVNFEYNVKHLNGSAIYPEIKARNYAMDKEELFSGLREGLKLMKTGETITFLFPSLKAYGYYGDENKIGTNVPLICEVKVNSIKDNN